MLQSDPPPENPWKTRKTLIERVANACEVSWKEFYQHYKGFVCSIAHKHGVAADDVDDLMQGVFVEIHRDFSHPEPPDFSERSFGAWLGQKVKWRVGEYHRHRYRREFATDPEDLCMTECDEPFDTVWNAEWERKVVELAMQRIVEKPRNLLIFHALAIQQQSVEEVCGLFGITRTNADTIKNRVKAKLEPIVQEIEAGEF
ncbi:MAG: sigma-70 family RNA polymerase sigma factor [Akkermansiaceae bacterium]|nr:sigma-70 family RNA polymerase sigma factor [Akkermansiaceae bacterium]